MIRNFITILINLFIVFLSNFILLINYLFVVIILGLSQMIAVGIILKYHHHPYDFEVLFKNGSVFFFSTSLVFNNLFILCKKLKLNDVRLNWKGIMNQLLNQITKCISWIIVPLVSILSLLAYPYQAADALIRNIPVDFTGIYFFTQLLCGGLAIAYSIYVAAITGLFKSEIRLKEGNPLLIDFGN